MISKTDVIWSNSLKIFFKNDLKISYCPTSSFFRKLFCIHSFRLSILRASPDCKMFATGCRISWIENRFFSPFSLRRNSNTTGDPAAPTTYFPISCSDLFSQEKPSTSTKVSPTLMLPSFAAGPVVNWKSVWYLFKKREVHKIHHHHRSMKKHWIYSDHLLEKVCQFHICNCLYENYWCPWHKQILHSALNHNNLLQISLVVSPWIEKRSHYLNCC